MPEPAGKTRSKKTSISPARSAAFRLLSEVTRSHSAHSDDLLRLPMVNILGAQDRNLCTALTMGVLRWQLLLDELIAPLLTHKSKMDDEVRIALRLGAFQLLFLDRVPAHAAISDSVELTKRAGHRFASGLVNAVLRKLAIGSYEQSTAAERAHPSWLVQRWTAFFGAEDVSAICGYDQQQPPVSVRLASPEAESLLMTEGIRLEPGSFLTNARCVVEGDASGTKAVRNGVARIQDEGSQLVAELLGSGARKNAAILDCCAAPGGKTAILAERHSGSRIVACDMSAARVAKMQEVFAMRPGLTRIECRVADATQLSPAELFDLVLCDVPCSGTGTLARNPEIKLRLQPEDFARQQERQIAILQSSLRAVAPGGELVYSTCSLEPEENEHVIEEVLRSEADFKILPMGNRIEQLRANGILHENGAALLLSKGIRGDFLRTTPGVLPVDGFFAAILSRK